MNLPGGPDEQPARDADVPAAENAETQEPGDVPEAVTEAEVVEAQEAAAEESAQEK